MLFDGLINFVTRLGSSADKGTTASYLRHIPTDTDAAYRTSWLRKIVDIPPFDEVREWRAWQAEEDQIEAIETEEKRLNIRSKVAEARILARKDGGSAIVLGVGGNAAAPLVPEMVREGGLLYVNVMMRNEIIPGERDNDPMSPYFGLPIKYTVNSTVQGPIDIHPSRVIRFIGNPVRELTNWDGWGDPIWTELRDAVRNADSIAQAVASMVQESKLDIMKIDGLGTGLATQEYEDLLVKRFQSVNMLKSIANVMIMDGKDEYEQKTLTFAGIPDIQDRALMIMAGMADIPSTRLLSRSPQGMNATGDSDMRNYYDRIRAGQYLHLGPLIRPLDELLIRSATGGRDPSIYYDWNPLYSMTEAEAATVEKTIAETIQIYSTQALIPDTALAAIVRNGIIERGQMPGAEGAFEAADAEGDLAGVLDPEPSTEELLNQAKLTLLQGGKSITADADPRTLYVRRDVVNTAEIIKWARSQGFNDIVQDLHVTIAYSRTPVDWFKVGTSWSDKLDIAAGGPRQMAALGPDGKYLALLFTANELVWRNREIIEAGASWDWPDYQPHISIQIGGEIDLSKIEPYQGRIVLGPEIFEEVRE